MPTILNSSAYGFDCQLKKLVAAKREGSSNVVSVVSEIIADIRKRGDTALAEYTKKFDKFDCTAANVRVSTQEIEQALKQCPSDVYEALEFAAKRIRAFHERSMPQDFRYVDEAGVTLGARWSAVDAVGLYVPGGLAAYPSSLLMNAVPARVAGVGRIAIAMPTPNGVLNPILLAAAYIAGVDEIYRIGGAQAIAAFAYGTDTVARVDKITGPGNAYVAEAKRQVFGVVGIDMIAGPSEILVIADAENEARHIAADLISQMEHDESAQAILLTPCEDFAMRIVSEIEAQLTTLPRADIAKRSWQNWGIVIVTEDLQQAAGLCNQFAPEHAELCVKDPEALLPHIRHAGSVFLGKHTPEAIGDYVAGTNHVLPTSRSARFSSGLNVLDFMKRSTIIGCDSAALEAIGAAAITLARAEGLEAHARSVAYRIGNKS